MKTTPSFIAALLAAFALTSFASAQNQRAPTPAPTTLPGAKTEIYKTIGDVELPLHIFSPEDGGASDSRPAIVFFFGGGWRSGSPAQFQQHCAYLASRGMVAITVEYRVSSRHQTKAVTAFQDAKSAMRYVRANAKRLGIDPNRVAAGGGSAGGHLAAALGTISAHDDPNDDTSISAVPDALCLYNPAVVLASIEGRFELPQDRASGLRERLGVPLESLSPFHNIEPGQPPAIIFHGEADTTVPFESVQLFSQKSQSKGNRCELVAYPGQPHGFFNYKKESPANFIATVTETDKFLNSLGYVKGKPRVEAFLKKAD